MATSVLVSPAKLAERLMIVNLKLWHLEDQCRRTDVEDSLVCKCKRQIDQLNQERHDIVNELDILLVDMISGKEQVKVRSELKQYNDPELNPVLRKGK